MLTDLTAPTGARHAAADVAVPFDEVVRRSHALRMRVRELELANEHLQRQVELEARRLQTVMRELVLAADRAGTQPLARAMRAVAAWQSDLSSVIDAQARPTPGGKPSHPQAPSAPVLRLSVRELEVLRLLTEGSRSPCIAVQLGISAGTVEVHRRNIMRKLGLHCVADLTKYAVRQGLTSL